MRYKVALGLILAASVAFAGGQISVMDPITKLPKTLKGGAGIDLSSATNTITATGVPAGGVTDNTFKAYTSASGGRATNDRVDTVQNQVTAQAVGSALGATAIQPVQFQAYSTAQALKDAAQDAAINDSTIIKEGELWEVNVTWAPYNADKTGATDTTAAINAAISAVSTAGGGTVRFPKGKYKFTPPLVLPSNVKLVGAGFSTDDSYLNASATILSVGTTYDGPAISIGIGTSMQYGNGIENLTIALNDKARGGIYFNAAASGTYKNVFVLGNANGTAPTYAQYGYFLTATASSPAATNTMHNVFENVKASMVNNIYKFGWVPNSNVCHNTFINCGGSFYTDGMDLVGSDNNVFILTFLFARPGATGYGVKITHGGAYDASYWLNLQADRGMYIGPNASATVFGYDQTNGQPAPTLADSTAQLSWTTDNPNSDGWHLAGNLNLLPASVLTDGTVSKTLAQLAAGGVSDGDKGDITVSGSGAAWAIDANSVDLGTDTAGDYVSGATADGGLVKTGTEGATLGLGTCADGQVKKYISGVWSCADDTGGTGSIGGSTGATDNAVLVADGTGGATVKSSTVTITPSGQMEIVSPNIAAGNPSLVIRGNYNTESIGVFSYNSSPGPSLRHYAALGTSSSPSAVTANTILQSFYGYGWNGTAFGGSVVGGSSPAAGIVATASEAHSTTAKGAYIDFQTTANTTTSRTTKMRIQGDGNVGIGTTSPGEKLEVAGNIKASTYIISGHEEQTASYTVSKDSSKITLASGTATVTLPASLPAGHVAVTVTVAGAAASGVSIAAASGGSVNFGDAGTPTYTDGKTADNVCHSQNAAATTTAAWRCVKGGNY